MNQVKHIRLKCQKADVVSSLYFCFYFRVLGIVLKVVCESIERDLLMIGDLLIGPGPSPGPHKLLKSGGHFMLSLLQAGGHLSIHFQ